MTLRLVQPHPTDALSIDRGRFPSSRGRIAFLGFSEDMTLIAHFFTLGHRTPDQ